MLELMLKTDICISGGGQTIYELARVGVPTIGICFAENQMLNLKNWMKIGFMNFVGWNNEENVFERIKNIIHKMDYNKRFKMSQVGRKFVNGQGAIRVVEKITHYVMSRDVLFSI
jgi:spore coat polysaccharide biosynthesis predicted glycosyltransferase SpsG